MIHCIKVFNNKNLRKKSNLAGTECTASMTEINSARPDYELVKVTLCYISFLWIAQLTRVNMSLLCFIHHLRETTLWPQTAMTPNCHFNTITCAEEQPVWAVTLFSGSGQSSFHPQVCPEKLCSCFASFRCLIVTSRIRCYVFLLTWDQNKLWVWHIILKSGVLRNRWLVLIHSGYFRGLSTTVLRAFQ